ncbi:WD40 repeat domain-containing serine/threonine protein kinase [Nocardiopsis sp. EMB25]|uniref:WD40 repeat domain-containing serine/threonine protein kinase n=1 Tax=Nocardiopsis sp. EMB25 TaxID=2835867 RepID=UPI0022849D0F|nr:WD40 repeat domain-containing serine/threonine protein kinase [Nocardiopsis sp. EMB25]MCY9786311.1 WD40 repeat domain-containing serine/threonine protein kinase [Nocardiopsis sp. EMB25]
MQQPAPDDPSRVGPYRIAALLGAGGMGRVYLGLDAAGTSAAVKVVRAEYAYDPDFRERFAQELELARLVLGENVPRVLAADTSGQTPWMATEYVMGPSLHDLVHATGPLPEESVRFLGRGVARALEGVHAKGLVHRDLKPGNVMVSADGAQVIDFGIAGAMEDARHGDADRIVGTPGYMSPEIVREQRCGAPSDVFALGGMLVYALTGTGPFGEGHPSAVMYRVANQDPVLTGVPESLRGLVASCLDKDPDRRPTAAEVLRALGGSPEPAPHAAAWLPPAAREALDEVAGEHRDAVRSTALAKGEKGPLAGRLLIAGAAAVALMLMGGFGVWSLGGPDLVRAEPGEAVPSASAEPVEREVCDPAVHLADEFTEPAESGELPEMEGRLHPAFSTDGSVLAIGSPQGIFLLNWRDGTRLAWIDVEIPPLRGRPVFSPNDCELAFTSDDGTHVYTLETGESTVLGPGQNVTAAEFSPDGSEVTTAAGGPTSVVTYDVESGDVVHAYEEADSAAEIVAYSPDGSHLGAHTLSGEVLVWDTGTRELVAYGDGHSSPLFDPDLVLTEDDEVLYYNESGPRRQVLGSRGEPTRFVPADPPGAPLDQFVYSPQADRLYATYREPAADLSEGVMKVWEFSTGEELTAESDEGFVAEITLHPDGEIFVGFPPTGSGMWVVDAVELRLITTID